VTDIDLMQDYIRAANPIQRVDDLDTDELAHFVTTTHTRRSAITQTPTQHETRPAAPGPPARRRNAWVFAAAFAVVLLVIGLATLVLRGGDTPVTNEPATPTTVTDAAVPTTVGVEQSPPIEVKPESPMVGVDPDVFLDAWQQIAVGEAWPRSVVDIEALPDGGFVAVTSEPDPWSLMWSPNGIEWHDGDPQRQVPGFPAWIGGFNERRSVEVTADQVVVLDEVNIGVWVGDPQTGQWEPIRLDTSGFDGRWRTMALAANASEVLVVAAEELQDAGDEALSTSSSQIVIWLVDISEHTSTRTSLPVLTLPIESDTLVEWLNDRWIMMVPRGVADPFGCSVWMSLDGASWTETALPDRLAEWCGSSLTAGPSGLVVTRSSWGGDDFWHSPDGLDWELAYDRSAVAKSTYSETLGYVVEVTLDYDPESQDEKPAGDSHMVDAILTSTDGDAIMVSADGRTWHFAGPARPRYGGDLLLVASNGKLLVRDDLFRLWLWTKN